MTQKKNLKTFMDSLPCIDCIARCYDPSGCIALKKWNKAFAFIPICAQCEYFSTCEEYSDECGLHQEIAYENELESN